jgi:hypothetical protein
LYKTGKGKNPGVVYGALIEGGFIDILSRSFVWCPEFFPGVMQ